MFFRKRAPKEKLPFKQKARNTWERAKNLYLGRRRGFGERNLFSAAVRTSAFGVVPAIIAIRAIQYDSIAFAARETVNNLTNIFHPEKGFGSHSALLATAGIYLGLKILGYFLRRRSAHKYFRAHSQQFEMQSKFAEMQMRGSESADQFVSARITQIISQEKETEVNEKHDEFKKNAPLKFVNSLSRKVFRASLLLAPISLAISVFYGVGNPVLFATTFASSAFMFLATRFAGGKPFVAGQLDLSDPTKNKYNDPFFEIIKYQSDQISALEQRIHILVNSSQIGYELQELGNDLSQNKHLYSPEELQEKYQRYQQLSQLLAQADLASYETNPNLLDDFDSLLIERKNQILTMIDERLPLLSGTEDLAIVHYLKGVNARDYGALNTASEYFSAMGAETLAQQCLECNFQPLPVQETEIIQ